MTGSSEHMCQPLLDAVAAHLKSPVLNHTLQRTFGPAVRALHGPPLRYCSLLMFLAVLFTCVQYRVPMLMKLNFFGFSDN